MQRVERRPLTRWISPANPWPFKLSVVVEAGKPVLYQNVPIERVRVLVERVKVRR